MQRRAYSPVLFLLMLMIGSACSRTPDHARHIPPDALCFVGLNTREISREIAWSALSGSELFRKLQERNSHSRLGAALGQLEHAGIRLSSTIYMYLRSDTRYDENIQTTVLIPLSDVKEWEEYVHRVFPNVPIRQRPGFREILVEGEAVAGWNEHLLVVTNVVHMHTPGHVSDVDTTRTSAALADLFLTTRKKGLTGDKRFRKLHQQRHDFTLWINYDAAMAHALGNSLGGITTMGVAGALWRGAVLTTGIDFKKGQIKGTIKYYVPDELKNTYRNLEDGRVHRDMLLRISPHNLILLASAKAPIERIRQLLDETGLNSVAALLLMKSGLTPDQVLDAFAGDIVVAAHHDGQALQYLTAFKIGRKDAFRQLLEYAITENLLMPLSANTYSVQNTGLEGNSLLLDDEYGVIANNTTYASEWLRTQKPKKQLPPAIIQPMTEHLAGMYFAPLPPKNSSTPLLQYIIANTAGYKDDAYVIHLEAAFHDKKENSLLQLIDFIIRNTDET